MKFIITLLCITLCAHAQHDAHREAVIDLTHGRIEASQTRLEKVFDDPASLWRGQSGAYARAGKTLRERGDSYRELVIPETHYTLSLLHSKQGNADEALQHAKSAIANGIPLERFLAGPREPFHALYNHPDFKSWVKTASIDLLHGPMLGNITHDGASFWVRTARESNVEIRVDYPGTDPITATSRTTAAADFTTVVRVSGLKPDSPHTYSLHIDGRDIPLPNPTFRTHPPIGQSSRFQVAFTACAGYAPEHERVWLTIEKQNPLALLMLGDNVYIDDPEHSITQQFCYYRRFSRPEWRQLVGGRGVYAIWDDHDFGIDDSFGGPDIDTPAWKPDVWKIFTQNWNNPSYGGGPKQPGVWFDFHIGDVHFIMLDGRYYREPNDRFKQHPAVSETPSMLGPVQLSWLKETLMNSQSTFKIIASPVPWAEGSTAGHNKLDKWDGYLAERNAIFDFLHQNSISGVVLISGDRHRSDARRIDRANGYPLHDFMSAIPTNYHTHPIVKGPGFLFGHNEKNTFGLLRFDTTLDDPTLTFEIRSIDDESIWSHELRLSELRD